MRLAFVFSAYMLFALPVFADEPKSASVADLIAGLRDDDAAKRDACEAELFARWDAAHEEMERAEKSEKDAEARARLRQILERGPAAAWVDTVAKAMEASKKDGRPVLAIRGDGAKEKPDTLEGRMCRAMLDEPEVVEALRGFRVVWIAEAGLPGTPDANVKAGHQVEGYGAVEFYAASPKLGLCHYVRGWWDGRRFARELTRAKAFAKAADREELKKLREGAFAELKKEFDASGCANARRHLHPWHCGAEGCTLRRLGICYQQGDGILGAEVAKELPAKLAGGESAKLPF
ncbi:MAG: hypothetical protein FD180_3869 [Planctomycetota bacterium]|nr:MAG: hypothetical protein FD180_3869 [Planctomycetota bacterium]